MTTRPQDETSLDRLHDIVEAAPVSAWPPGPGWWLLFGLVLAGMAAIALRSWIAWRKAAYRREALVELNRVEARAAKGAPPIESLEAVQLTLKRVALAVWPRPEVASLTGRDWLAFLDRTGGQGHFGRGIGRYLAEASYDAGAANEVGAKGVRALLEIARAWVRDHRAPEARS